jgi:GntR family transcriptional regulator / MocR family aminotransferase
MPKRTTALELVLAPREAGESATNWLYAALRAEILDGRLRPGARLPATRDLARQYRLSRGTIVAAFELLRSEGYLEGRVGAGTFVSRVLRGNTAPPSRRPAAPMPSSTRYRLSVLGRRVRTLAGYAVRPTRAFRANMPALDLFPITLWAQLAARRLRGATPRQLLGCDTIGYQPLREAVADYLITSRGVRCMPDQVVIVSGLQEALDLAARVLLEPGQRVCVEDPGYDGAVFAFEMAGARMVGVPVDEEGMEVPGPATGGARLAYITPAHQFPLGITMTLPRRLALLAWARRAGALIVEDDYDSEFRYAGRPVPALQGLDRDGLVLLAGTFSKVLFPSLRLGYLVVPERLVERFTAVKSVSRGHAPLLDQVVLCDFIAAGHFGRHIRRMREIYAERLGALLESARRLLAGRLDITTVEAGLQTAALLEPGRDAAALARAAAQRQVEVVPLSTYARLPLARDGLQLGFAAVDPQEIRRGVTVLAEVLERRTRGLRPATL